MADSLNPVQLTPLLLPYTDHKNPKVRGQAARVLARSQSLLEVSGAGSAVQDGAGGGPGCDAGCPCLAFIGGLHGTRTPCPCRTSEPHANPRTRPPPRRLLIAKQGRAELGVDLATLLRAAGRLLTDNTPEAREAAKKLLTLVHTGFMVAPPATDAQPAAGEAGVSADEESEVQSTPWEAFCRAVLSGSTAIAVLKQEAGKEAC